MNVGVVNASEGLKPDSVFRFADDLGPAKIIHIHEPGVGLRAIVAIDNVACGPAIGGVRMAPDVNAGEAFRLARAMSFKNAVAGLPHGGGKSVIFGDPGMAAGRKEEIMRAFARAIEPLVDYIPGPDMGTDETCMAWIRDEIGRSVGLPREIGGIPLDEIGATGFGLAVCADVAQGFAGIGLEGARVAVQGFGSVGQHASRFLAQRGARIVAVADSGGTIHDDAGLDPDALIGIKLAGRSVVESDQGTPGPPDGVIGVDCDIWIPAARPDVVHRDNVNRLSAKLVLQGANIPITAEAEALLHERGVLVVPDFIANAGGVICASVEYRGGTQKQAFDMIEEKIGMNSRQVLEEAMRTKTQPRTVALGIADSRLRTAMGFSRWAQSAPQDVPR